MNLYEIRFRHYSQKDSEEGIITYLVANNDEQVYEWLKSEPSVQNGDYDSNLYNSLAYKDDPESDEFEEGFKERIIECCGEMYDDCSEVHDLYYGATQYGWKLVKEGVYYTDVIHAQNALGINIVDITS